MAETGVWDACASLAHVCATAASTRVDALMVTVDAADDVDGMRKDAFGMVLSAPVNNPSDAELHAVPKRMLVLSVDIVCGVNGDHEVIDARRRSGRADVRK